jgi:mRNA interferase MazF
MYNFGTVVLIPFPFTDLTSAKLRPALIVSANTKKSKDVMVAFISSKVEKSVPPSRALLKSTDKFFSEAGLKVSSVIFFDKIATLHKQLIIGEIGHINPLALNKLKKNFLAAFGF